MNVIKKYKERIIPLLILYLTFSFNNFPALKTGALQAGILISWLVCGLCPFLAALTLTSKEPNPTSCILLPFVSSSDIVSVKASKNFSEDAFDFSVFLK